MSGSFKTVLLGLKYSHDATETLGGSVGILVFDFLLPLSSGLQVRYLG